MRSAKQVRVLGWLQLVIGLFLIGIMGVITFFVAPLLMSPGGSSGFTGKPVQALMILFLFCLIIVFGMGAGVSGLLQIVTGRSNRWIIILLLGLGALLVVSTIAVSTALKS
jgi:hypothetical protein